MPDANPEIVNAPDNEVLPFKACQGLTERIIARMLGLSNRVVHGYASIAFEVNSIP